MHGSMALGLALLWTASLLSDPASRRCNSNQSPNDPKPPADAELQRLIGVQNHNRHASSSACSTARRNTVASCCAGLGTDIHRLLICQPIEVWRADRCSANTPHQPAVPLSAARRSALSPAAADDVRLPATSAAQLSRMMSKVSLAVVWRM